MEYVAQSVQEAIEQGLKDLKVTRQDVEVTVLQEGKKGFLGLGKQLAKVELTLKAQPQVEQSKNEADLQVTQPEKQVPVEEENLQVEQSEQQEENQAEFEQALIAVGNYLAEITKHMGVQTSIDVTPEKNTVFYEFDTKQEGLLIGKHGKTLNSLQLLAQDYLDKKVKRRVKVILDVANYRQRRAETLTNLAKKVARDALTKKRVQQLDPMPAYERKVIHSALADNKKVKTYSKGTEPYRSVVIEPLNK